MQIILGLGADRESKGNSPPTATADLGLERHRRRERQGTCADERSHVDDDQKRLAATRPEKVGGVRNSSLPYDTRVRLRLNTPAHKEPVEVGGVVRWPVQFASGNRDPS